jgi:hypothetical protein
MNAKRATKPSLSRKKIQQLINTIHNMYYHTQNHNGQNTAIGSQNTLQKIGTVIEPNFGQRE